MNKGQYTIKIQPEWNSKIFGGNLYFGITDVNDLGGENHFLGYSFLVVGIIAFIFAILFIV